MGTQSTWGVPSKTLSEQHLLLYVCNLSTMAPNENIAVGRVLTTYKVADKAMDIPVVNDVVTGVKKMADPITPYVEGTLKMMKGKAEESLSPEVKEKVGSTLGSLGSKIDNLACNGLDQLTTAVPSLQTATTPELMENTKEAAISVVDTAQEYIASFKVARFGIRVFDAYLSVIEAPLSVLSSSVTSKVQGVRRHLRAVRRAGARRDGEPCQDGSLLIEMSQVFKINILLGFLGMQLVKIEEPQAAPTTSAEKEDSVRSSSDEEEEDDPDYVPEQRESDDSLEYRSDTEVTQESQDDDLLVVAELEDCPTTPNCEKVEHKIVKNLGEEVVKDLGKEVSSEESEGSEESDLEIEEVQEVDSECNTPACEKPKHQVVPDEVEVVVKVLDNELEDDPEEIEVADIAQEDDQEKVEVEDIEVKDNPEEVEVADIELEDNAEEVEVAGIELEDNPKEVEVADIELEDNPEELEVAELEDCPTTPNCEKVEHKIVKEVAEDISKVLKRAGSSSSSDEDLN